MLVTLDMTGLAKLSRRVYARHIPSWCTNDERACVVLCYDLTEDNIVTILMHEEVHHALYKMFEREINLQVSAFNALNASLDDILGGWKDTRKLLDPDYWPPPPPRKKLKMKRNVKI